MPSARPKLRIILIVATASWARLTRSGPPSCPGERHLSYQPFTSIGVKARIARLATVARITLRLSM
jgi:hypothetical protein